ncbi:HNH endonuclease signature motif containing protein [Arvimicrobium flavum]|uniref:HNH endonuclease signature motif containing protein n=1 Tax=Arvimicrobium flavum TaxID=3393320 RepID=UPI00237BF340|nr:HNH endonuclease signature motif containing protein [Mesorhizobium shangrilense]
MRRGPIAYSAAELAWLEINRTLVISDYRRAFCAAFGRDEVSAAHLHALRKRNGWKVGRAPGRYVGRGMKYTGEELAWLRDNCTLPIADYHRAFCDRFGRTETSAAKLNSLRKRQGWKTGRTGHFEKGAVPANKGKPCPAGTGGRHPNARKTQFSKGQLPHNYKGPGHESVDEDGYVWIITDATNPWTGAATWRVHKHRWLWEQANGPVPEGMVLKCLDGNRQNTDPSNWQAIPQGLLPRLNGKSGRNYDHAPAELKPTIMAVARLEHGARTALSRSTRDTDPVL